MVSLPVARAIRERRRMSTRTASCAAARAARAEEEATARRCNELAPTKIRARADANVKGRRSRLRFGMAGNHPSGFSTHESANLLRQPRGRVKTRLLTPG